MDGNVKPSAAPSESRARFEKWVESLPKCALDCDGDLPGEGHDENCPAKNGGDLMSMEYYEIWAAAERDIREQLAQIIENEPLGYRTEDEHEKLENFADRLAERVRGKGAQ